MEHQHPPPVQIASSSRPVSAGNLLRAYLIPRLTTSFSSSAAADRERDREQHTTGSRTNTNTSTNSASNSVTMVAQSNTVLIAAEKPSTTLLNQVSLDFYDSVLNNDLERLKRIVEVCKINLNSRFTQVRKKNHKDLLPIHLVSYKGYLEMLHFLIQSGASVNQQTATLKRLPIHYAALRHQAACMQMLLNAGSKIDAQDTFGNSPLHYVAEDGHAVMISMLINRGANVDLPDITQKTALMKATRNGKIAAVKRLLNAEASALLKDRNDDSALHFAARHGSVEISSMLLRNGAKIDAQNVWGMTALMEAVNYNQKDVVLLLIKRKGDLYKRDFRTGDTALHIAVKKNYLQIVEVLLAAGRWSIPYSYNNAGESFVHDVVVYNRVELLKLFILHNYNFDYVAKRYVHGALLQAAQPSRLVPDGSLHDVERSLVPAAAFDDDATLAANRLNQTLSTALTLNINTDRAPFALAIERGHYELARMLALVGCYSSKTNSVKHKDELETVKPLKQWCRKVIRQRLGFAMLDAGVARSLPIPRSLQDYLCVPELDLLPSTARYALTRAG